MLHRLKIMLVPITRGAHFGVCVTESNFTS